MNNKSIFISYTSSQALWAKWVHNELVSIGFDVEMDKEDWHLGEGLVGKINAAILNHDIFLALWSKDYFVKERWTFDEINAAYTLHRQGRPVIVPFYVEPGCTVPPLYRSLIGSELFDRTETAARRELRLKLELYVDRHLGALPAPDKQIPFPGSVLVSQIAYELATKFDLLKNADAQARRVLDLAKSVDMYALENTAKHLRILSRSYNSEPPFKILQNVDVLWNDLLEAAKLAQNSPSRLADILVMEALAFGLQSYAALDLGNPGVAFSSAVAMKSCAENAKHAELVAWALGTQALLLWLDKKHKRALLLISEGLGLPISGMARSWLHCLAALSWAELGDLQNTIASIRESEMTVNSPTDGSTETEVVSDLFKTKHQYYIGTVIIRTYFDQGLQLEKDDAHNLSHLTEADDNLEWISDDWVAISHLATSLFRRGRIDELSYITQPALTGDQKFSTSWYHRWLQQMGADLKASERFRDLEVTAIILDDIKRLEQEFER